MSLLLLFSCEVVSNPLATPWTGTCKAQQEYWNGLPFHSPGRMS